VAASVPYSSAFPDPTYTFLQTSPDGATWTPAASANALLQPIVDDPALGGGTLYIQDLRYNGSVWLADIYTSPTTVNYTIVSLDPTSTWYLLSNIDTAGLGTPNRIGWNSNLWVIGGTGLATSATANGSAWDVSDMSSVNPGGTISAATWNGVYWIAAGVDAANVSSFYYSSNAVNWTASPINTSNASDSVTGPFILSSIVRTGGGGGGGPPCFLEGTKVLCFVDDKEVYLPIQTLTKGTLVKTSTAGYKPVTYLGYSLITSEGLSSRGRDQLYVCLPAQYPELTEPLYITGCHSILVDSLTEEQRKEIVKVYKRVFVTEGKYRLESYLDERASPWLAKGKFTVWHVALENENEVKNYGIYAHGLLVESICNKRIKTSKTLTIV